MTMVDDSFNIIGVFWVRNVPRMKYFLGYLHFVTGGILKCNLVLFG